MYCLFNFWGLLLICYRLFLSYFYLSTGCHWCSYMCVSCQESEERRPKIISYFIELNEYKPQNRKCAEMAEFANQFGNTLCPDKISFDAFKTELEAKVKELNEKYPKTMPLKISSGIGFIHIDQDTKTHNNGCDKPVAYFFIYRVKRIYRFSERPQIEKKGGAE